MEKSPHPTQVRYRTLGTNVKNKSKCPQTAITVPDSIQFQIPDSNFDLLHPHQAKIHRQKGLNIAFVD